MISREGDSLRVLMICPQFRPLVGGYERAAERLAVALAEDGMRVTVVTERRDRAWPVTEHLDGYELRRVSCSYHRHRHAITSLLSFTSFLLWHGREFDVWHAHQYGMHAVLATALSKLLRRPIVLKLPSSGRAGIETCLGGGIIGRILRSFLLRVDACVVVSDETRQEAIRFGIPVERIHLVPDGLDGRQFRPASQQERAAARGTLGLDCERLALYVGRLSVEKNPVGLLDAWAAVDATAREGGLLALVGAGPEWANVHARVQMPNLQRSVLLAGERSDVATWYRAADLYVVPSHIEGLSVSMIEALASGLPVISTRVSGSSILVEAPPAGLVVKVADKELTAAIETLLTDEPRRTELSKNARSLFESRFSLDIFSKKTALLYRSLLKDK